MSERAAQPAVCFGRDSRQGCSPRLAGYTTRRTPLTSSSDTSGSRGAHSGLCASCHREDFCTGCHDGRVRPRAIHPGDYLSMHATEARLSPQRCTSCHNQQSFCLGCHQRTGVSMSGPPGVRTLARFHPPKELWSGVPPRAGDHGYEAVRNLNACVSCHIERACVVCHGGRGIGGGFNPHGPGFAHQCASLLSRNPRACLVCHLPDDEVLSSCR